MASAGSFSKRIILVVVLVLVAMVFPARLLAADTTIGVQVCNTVVAPPSVTNPAADAATADSSIIVSGTGPASTTIYHFRNSAQVGFVTSAGDGSYSLSVPLVVGANVLHTSVLDECNEFVDSPAVTITRTAVPADSIPGVPTTTPGSSDSGQTTTTPAVTAPPTPVADTAGLITPVIHTPKHLDKLSSENIVVTGQAGRLTTVKILLNGKAVAEVLTDDQGRFSVSLSLVEGENHLVVSSGDGDSLRKSTDVVVYYQPPADIDVIGSPWWLLPIIAVGSLFLVYLLVLRHWAKPNPEDEDQP